MQLRALQELVVSAIGRACNIDPDSIPVDANVLDLGVDSLVLVSIVNQVAVDYDVTLTNEQTLELFEAESLVDLTYRLHCAIQESGLPNEREEAN